MKVKSGHIFSSLVVLFFSGILISCEKSTDDNETPLPPGEITNPVFLIIDEESIDNGNPPNNFSANDVNDQLATEGFRTQLRYFRDRPGKEITLYTGQVGDEGWFAVKNIPSSWKSAGPSDNGALNFYKAAPGLGGNGNEDLLDEVPDIIPLRARGLKMLVNQVVIAVVYDSDISINYDPIEASLKGATLGVVAFKVLSISKRTDGSSSDLPVMKIKILNADEVIEKGLYLFKNVPTIQSSSEPFDIDPPANVAEADIQKAD